MTVKHQLESESWTANGTKFINTDSLPPRMRAREIVLQINLVGTKDAADALDGQLLAKAITNVKIGSMINIPGIALQELGHHIAGRIANDPTDIPGTGTAFDSTFYLTIPFRDRRQPGSEDGGFNTELLMNQPVEITFAAANIFGGTALVITSGTIRAHANLVFGSGIPQIQKIGYFNAGSQTVQLMPDMVYKELFLLKDLAGSTLTAAEISMMDFEVDGQIIINNLTHGQIVGDFNAAGVIDTAAELTSGAARCLPVSYLDQSGKSNLTKQPAAEKSARLLLNGTLTNPIVVYWSVIPKGPEAVKKVAMLTGGPDIGGEETVYEPQTASKAPFLAAAKSMRRGKKGKRDRVFSRALPGKMRTVADAPFKGHLARLPGFAAAFKRRR